MCVVCGGCCSDSAFSHWCTVIHGAQFEMLSQSKTESTLTRSLAALCPVLCASRVSLYIIFTSFSLFLPRCRWVLLKVTKRRSNEKQKQQQQQQQQIFIRINIHFVCVLSSLCIYSRFDCTDTLIYVYIDFFVSSLDYHTIHCCVYWAYQ